MGRARWMASTALILVAGVATPAFSQDRASVAAEGEAAGAPHKIEEVVVTARRKAENLQSVPVAVTALSGENLRDQTITKFEDIQRIAPGFTSGLSTRGGASSTYTIRGQRGALSQTAFLDPAVSVYFAEFNLSRPTGSNQSLFDLQSIQVLKGPQGTLFGRNSTGGAVLITPQTPTGVFEGYGQVSVGNYNYADFEGAINIPLGDKVAVRAAAKLSERDGYLKNVLRNDRANDLDAQSYRLSVAFRPTDNIESTFIGSYFKGGGYGTDLKLYVIEPRAIPASLGVGRQIVINKLQQELAAAQALGRREYRNNSPQISRDNAKSIQNTTTIELGDTFLGEITLKNIAGYREIKNRYNNNFTGAGFDLFSYPASSVVGNLISGKSWSEEFQVQGKAGNLDYIAGAYYFEEEGKERFVSQNFAYLSSPEVLAMPGVPVAQFRAAFPSATLNNFDSKNISYAAFLHANYNLSDLVEGLSVSGGIRFTKDKRSAVYRTFRYSGLTPTAYTCALTLVVYPTPDAACVTPATVSASEPTYDVSVNFQASPDLLLYAAHRHGYRSGGFNAIPPPVPPFPLSTRAFGPEKVDDVELGLKSDFTVGDMAGRLNVAAFHQWYSDIQRNTIVQVGSTTNTIVANVAKAHSDGAEVELTLRPTEGLELSANYAYIRAKYDKYITTGNLDVSDASFPGIPAHQYSVSLAYTLPLAENVGELTIRGTISGQSKVGVADPDSRNCGPTGADLRCLNRNANLPGYSTIDFRADWRNVMDAGLDVALFVRNVTNEFHFTFAPSALGQLGYAAASVNAPRMWGLELRVPFGAMRR